ncbi:MAG: glycoside hydrolase family 5 protein, partial [Solirubrobacterales bacterium]
MARLAKTTSLGLFALAACLLLPASPASAATPSLEVNGNRIQDTKTGNEFIPRGVNWPSFEYACVQGWGYSNEGANPDTARAMLDWNINTVRIPLNQDCWLGDDGQPANDLFPPISTPTGYRDAVSDFVAVLTEAGLVVILDLHWTGQNGTVAEGLRPMADNRSDDFWTSTADRFKTNDAVIFDLFNEPHSRWDPAAHDWAFLQTWSCWRSGGCRAPDQADTDFPITGESYTTVGMGSLLAAVRGTGANNPVILSGLDYANDLSEWSERAPADDQLIAGFHNYPGQECSYAACWTGEIATVAAEHPVITAEFGQRNCQTDHLERYMDWADQRGIGYLAWAWWVLPVEGCTNYA